MENINCNKYENTNTFAAASKYPAFQYKVTGVVENSHHRSNDEEISLVKNLESKLSHKGDPSYLYVFNTPVTSVTQGFQKPICGLVALHMAADMLRQLSSTVCDQSLTDIFQHAVECKMTKQGEMFSTHDMARLASDIYQCKAEVLKGNLFENRHILLSHLLQGHPVLVPYDNDKNFEPCLQNGHRAHWAVITGVVIQVSSKLALPGTKDKFSTKSNVYRVKKCDHSVFYNQIKVLLQTNQIKNLHVFIKQGKSAKNRLWCLENLARSNSNLYERDPERNWDTYHCPDPLRETLKDKVVILS